MYNSMPFIFGMT